MIKWAHQVLFIKREHSYMYVVRARTHRRWPAPGRAGRTAPRSSMAMLKLAIALQLLSCTSVCSVGELLRVPRKLEGSQYVQCTNNRRAKTDDEITCDWRLVEQNKYSGWGAQLRVMGYSDNRSICISGGHFGDGSTDGRRFLTYNRSYVAKMVEANVLPAVGRRDFAGLIVMDLERMAAPSKFGSYGSALLQQIVGAILLRISVTREIFPVAKLAIYGSGVSSIVQLRGFERAGAHGLWSALDYLVPSFYLGTVNATNSEGGGVKAAPNASAVLFEVDAQLQLTTAFAQRYSNIRGIAPFLSWLYEGRADRTQNCAVPKELQRAVIAAVVRANGTKMIQFWAGDDSETTSRNCRGHGSTQGELITQLQYLQQNKFVPIRCLHNAARETVD